MQVVEKLSIKSTKHGQAIAEQNSGMPASWFGSTNTDLEVRPLMTVGVETANVADIILVASS